MDQKFSKKRLWKYPLIRSIKTQTQTNQPLKFTVALLAYH